MALTETTKVDQIEVRTATIIQKDGVELTRTHHRHTKAPGEDISNEDAKVQAIANAIWTAEVIAAYQASIALPE